MQPDQNNQNVPIMDIQNPQPGAHRSRKIVITLSVLLVLLAATSILLQLKARRDYFRSPEGELQLLRESSEEVTASPQEQKEALEKLRKSSAPITPEDRLNALQNSN